MRSKSGLSGFAILLIKSTFLFQVSKQYEQCKSATGPISSNTHLYATDDLHVANIAFSSCYVPESVTGTSFWNDVRMKVKLQGDYKWMNPRSG